jgi:hippurate hydrolase
MLAIVLSLLLSVSLFASASAQDPLLVAGPPVNDARLDTMLDGNVAWLLATYKMLHAAPELSHREEKTSIFFAGELRKFGYTVTERLGKFEHPEWSGYGLIGVLKNGNGPTVLLRTELDALRLMRRLTCLMRAR